MLAILLLDYDPKTADYEGMLRALLVVLAVACATLATMLIRDWRKKRASLAVEE